MAAQRQALEQYIGRQEYIELYYGPGGRLVGGDAPELGVEAGERVGGPATGLASRACWSASLTANAGKSCRKTSSSRALNVPLRRNSKSAEMTRSWTTRCAASTALTPRGFATRSCQLLRTRLALHVDVAIGHEGQLHAVVGDAGPGSPPREVEGQGQAHDEQAERQVLHHHQVGEGERAGNDGERQALLAGAAGLSERLVGDAGMVSKDNLKKLALGGGRYIVCMPVHVGGEVAREVIRRPGRYQQVAENLQVKEVVTLPQMVEPAGEA